MIRFGRVCTILGLFAVVGAAPLAAQDQKLQGAAAALKALNRAAADKPKATDPVAAFREDLRPFRERVATLPPKEAATRWLALVERFLQLKPNPEAVDLNFEPMQFQEVLEAMPPPAAWNDLAAAIAARRVPAGKPSAVDTSLLLLAHVLQGNADAQWRDLAALEAMATKGRPDEQSNLAGYVMQISETLTAQSGDPVRVLKGIELRLAIQKTVGGQSGLTLPDLVTLLGPQQARALLTRLLTTSPAAIQITSGDATRKLAAAIALEQVAKLKAPQWTLTHSLDAGALFEALEKRFPVVKAAAEGPALAQAMAQRRGLGAGDQSRSLAEVYYLLGLIANGRQPQALARLPKLSATENTYALRQPLSALDRAGHTRAVSVFLGAALAKDPKLPLWELYVDVSARAGEHAAMLGVIRAALDQPKLPAPARATLTRHLYTALLATDKVDEAVVLIRKELAAAPAAPAQGMQNVGSDRLSVGTTLARIGHLLGRKDLMEEGLAVVRTASKEDRFNSGYYAKSTAELLVELGRPAEAEERLIAALAVVVKQFPVGTPIQGGQDILAVLASLYHEAGRHADVMALLDDASNWGVSDLSEVLQLDGVHDLSLGYVAASALAARGDKTRAARILEELLLTKLDFDPAFALLVQLRGADALPFLDKVHALDRFQERALIWKAQVLLNQKKLDEAETVVREAITIDPSDGEQKFGRRMRVYAVLADILEAKGDAAQAKVFRGAVDAIRISERADNFYAAGLLTRAIKMYQEALGHFQNAYCIQSRLAVQLTSQGKFQEAEVHYRRAFELMPDSFGRVETHCFGCEGVFHGKRAEGIAEGVFKSLVMRSPEKPQLHYLLGYLREEQGRPTEALQHFRDAVKLDPDYINAWNKILGTRDSVRLPQATQDAALLNLVRLDPLGRHGSRELEQMSDLRGLWAAFEAAGKLQPDPAATDLYPLAASKAVQDKQELDVGLPARMRFNRMRFGGFGGRLGYPYDTGSRETIPTPAQAISQQRVIATVTQIVDEDVQRRQAQQ